MKCITFSHHLFIPKKSVHYSQVTVDGQIPKLRHKGCTMRQEKAKTIMNLLFV